MNSLIQQMKCARAQAKSKTHKHSQIIKTTTISVSMGSIYDTMQLQESVRLMSYAFNFDYMKKNNTNNTIAINVQIKIGLVINIRQTLTIPSHIPAKIAKVSTFSF